MSVADPSSEDLNKGEADDIDETDNSDCEHTSDGGLTVQHCRKIQALFQTMIYVG